MITSICAATSALWVVVGSAPGQAPPPQDAAAPASAPTAAETPTPEAVDPFADAAGAADPSSNSEAIAPVELNAPVAAPTSPAAAPGGAGEGAVLGAQPPERAGAPTTASLLSTVPAPQLEMVSTRVVEEEIVPHEIKWRLDLGVGGGSYSPLDESYGVFSGGMASVGRLDIDAGLSFPIGESGLYLGARVGYRMFEGELYDVHGIWLPTYTQQEINFGARLGFAVLDGVEPYVEMAGGPTLWRSANDEDLDLYSAGDGEFQDGSATMPMALADRTLGFVKGTAGVQLYLPRKWLPRKEGSRVTAGIDLNVGYVWRPSFDLTLVNREPVEGAIETTLPTFGSVNASAVTWSAGLFLRVM